MLQTSVLSMKRLPNANVESLTLQGGSYRGAETSHHALFQFLDFPKSSRPVISLVGHLAPVLAEAELKGLDAEGSSSPQKRMNCSGSKI